MANSSATAHKFDAAMKYDKVAVLMHWIIAAMMIYMVVFGEDLMSRRATDASGATWHASIGIAILVLSILRLLWRLANPPPLLPATMKPWEIKASHGTHWLFYIMMIGLPLTGLLGFADQVTKVPAVASATVFGLFNVPQPVLVQGWNWGGLHSLMSNIMYPLVALHVLAALKHQFIDKDGLLKRMT
jgi:cytochrome b561